MKQKEDRHYQMISCRELLPCVPFCLISSEGKSLVVKNLTFELDTRLKLKADEVERLV